MKNPIEKSNMFATPDSVESMTQYIQALSGSERTLAYIIAAMTMNLASKLVDEAIEKDEEVLDIAGA